MLSLAIVFRWHRTMWSAMNAAFAPIYLVFEDIKWKTMPQKGWAKHLIAALRGLAIAATLGSKSAHLARHAELA